MNVEVMYSVYFIKKMTERSETTLRHSIFDILRFCGSLFNFVKIHTSGTQQPYKNFSLIWAAY